jgi:hypothetical protein
MRVVFAVLAATLTVSIGFASAQKPGGTVVEMYRSPTCGCCLGWGEHMKKAGFDVRVTELDDQALEAFKDKRAVPMTARSCHTAIVNGYVVEGHVPVADLQRLLKERPAVAGIAVGGMPVGSPGMEVAGGRVQPFNTVSFTKAGALTVYASHK